MNFTRLCFQLTSRTMRAHPYTRIYFHGRGIVDVDVETEPTSMNSVSVGSEKFMILITFDRYIQGCSAKKLTERIVRKPEIEFYDISKDPDELENLAANPAHQARVQHYMAQLKAWMEEQGDRGAALDIPVKLN